MSAEESASKQAEESDCVRKLFVDKLDVDVEVADILIAEGFASLEEVAYVPMQEMLEIASFDEDTVNELRTRAKDALLTMDIARGRARRRGLAGPARLRRPDARADRQARTTGGVHSRDDLGRPRGRRAGRDDRRSTPRRRRTLIMKAREHWFAAEAEAQENAPRRRTPTAAAQAATAQTGAAQRRPRKDRHLWHRQPSPNSPPSSIARPRRCSSSCKSAGVSKASTDDSVTESDKARLLDHLRTAHGTAASGERKKITLTRKSTSEIKQADSSGKARTIQVEVRKKRTFVKRDEVSRAGRRHGRSPRSHEAELRRREEEAHAEAERLRVQEEELAGAAAPARGAGTRRARGRRGAEARAREAAARGGRRRRGCRRKAAPQRQGAAAAAAQLPPQRRRLPRPEPAARRAGQAGVARRQGGTDRERGEAARRRPGQAPQGRRRRGRRDPRR